MLGNAYSPEQSSVCLLSNKRGTESNYGRGEGGKGGKKEKGKVSDIDAVHVGL